MTAARHVVVKSAFVGLLACGALFLWALSTWDWSLANMREAIDKRANEDAAALWLLASGYLATFCVAAGISYLMMSRREKPLHQSSSR